MLQGRKCVLQTQGIFPNLCFPGIGQKTPQNNKFTGMAGKGELYAFCP
jgi:hypothetical protein